MSRYCLVLITRVTTNKAPDHTTNDTVIFNMESIEF